MLGLRSALALVCALCATACMSDDDGIGTGGVCPPGGSCPGANDCYSSCFCVSESTSQCEQRCGPRGTRVQDLDESEWLSEWVDFETEVVGLTNAERASGGCCGDEGCFPPTSSLTLSDALTRSARAHALDMAENDYFSHDSQDGRSPFDRMREAGFRGCAMGENIAAGQPTPSSVVDGWRKSPGHCANMLSPDFERIGVGYRPAPELATPHFWVQNFGD
jgi:uncharacterized protein YkwD